MKIVFTPPFIRNYKKIRDKEIRKRIKKIIERLSENPEIGKPLSSNLKNYRVLRIKPYRLVYGIKKDKLYLHAFQHRKSVYN